jgi:hypothetical protein
LRRVFGVTTLEFGKAPASGLPGLLLAHVGHVTPAVTAAVKALPHSHRYKALSSGTEAAAGLGAGSTACAGACIMSRPRTERPESARWSWRAGMRG